MSSKKQNKKTFKIIAFVIVLILIVGSLLLWDKVHKNNSLKVTPETHSSSVLTPSKTVPSPSTGSSQGGVESQNSQAGGVLSPPSEWSSSSNGDITLQQPIANSTIQSGVTLSGVASVNTIQFILTDNSVGLIAQGNLSVVNGKFSGTLQFTPHSSSGTLQVYYPNPNNGAEEDIVDINVNFNT